MDDDWRVECRVHDVRQSFITVGLLKHCLHGLCQIILQNGSRNIMRNYIPFVEQPMIHRWFELIPREALIEAVVLILNSLSKSAMWQPSPTTFTILHLDDIRAFMTNEILLSDCRIKSPLGRSFAFLVQFLLSTKPL